MRDRNSTFPENDHDLLLELRGDMKNVLKGFDDMKAENLTIHGDHEKRIRSLESQKDKWLGKETLVSGTLGAALTAATAFLTGHVR